MTYLSIGKVTIPSVWVAVILSLFLAAWLYKILTKKKIEDWYWNCFFLYVLTWKLTYIPFHFQLFLDMPLSIVYFNRGELGHILGLALVSIYIVMIARKKYHLSFTGVSQSFILYFLTYQLLIRILEKNIAETAILIAVFMVCLYLFVKINKRNLLLPVQTFMLIILLDFFFMSLFDSFFTQEALSFSWLGITVLLLSKSKGRVSHFE